MNVALTLPHVCPSTSKWPWFPCDNPCGPAVAPHECFSGEGGGGSQRQKGGSGGQGQVEANPTVDGAGWQAHVFTMLILLPLCPTGRVHEKLKLLRQHFSRKQTSDKKKIMVLCFLRDPEQVTSPLWASIAPTKNKLDVYGHVEPPAWRTFLSASDVLALDVG